MSLLSSLASDTSYASLAVLGAGFTYALHALRVFTDPDIDVAQLVCAGGACQVFGDKDTISKAIAATFEYYLELIHISSSRLHSLRAW